MYYKTKSEKLKKLKKENKLERENNRAYPIKYNISRLFVTKRFLPCAHFP